MAHRIALLACFGLSTLLTGTAVRGDDPKIEGDLKKLQGTWISKDDQGENTWKFEKDKLSIKTPSRAYEIKVTLDSAAKPFATMDLKATADSPNAANFLGKTIYKFDGEKKVTICFGGEETRPAEFKMDFPSSILFELTRKEN